MPDYMPKATAEFILWADRFVSYFFTNAIKWNVSISDATDLKNEWDDTKLLIEKAEDPAQSTHLIVAKKDAAVKAFRDKVRGFANHELRTRTVTDDDRIALGLPIHDTTPTPIGPPTTMPTFVLDLSIPRHIRLRYHDQDNHSEAKPHGVNGAVVAWGILTAPPVDQEDLPHTLLATRSPFTIDFHEADRGKTLYIALCWQNEKGQRGPWSNIEAGIIP
jgi:hypothetical protein